MLCITNVFNFYPSVRVFILFHREKIFFNAERRHSSFISIQVNWAEAQYA